MNDISHLVKCMKKPSQHTVANCIQTAAQAAAGLVYYAAKVSGSVLDKIPFFPALLESISTLPPTPCTIRNETKRQLPKADCLCLTFSFLNASVPQDFSLPQLLFPYVELLALPYENQHLNWAIQDKKKKKSGRFTFAWVFSLRYKVIVQTVFSM